MAKLSAHGRELDRREYCDCRIAVMSDGNIMRNYGQGWKLYKKVKPGVDIAQYARDLRAKYDARPEVFHSYIKALIDCTDLEHRARLHMAIDLMPEDPDGVWSEMDMGYYSVDIAFLPHARRVRQPEPMTDAERLEKALEALRTLAGCMPDDIFVFGAYGEIWQDGEPDTDEYELVQLQRLLKEIDI